MSEGVRLTSSVQQLQLMLLQPQLKLPLGLNLLEQLQLPHVAQDLVDQRGLADAAGLERRLLEHRLDARQALLDARRGRVPLAAAGRADSGLDDADEGVLPDALGGRVVARQLRCREAARQGAHQLDELGRRDIVRLVGAGPRWAQAVELPRHVLGRRGRVVVLQRREDVRDCNRLEEGLGRPRLVCGLRRFVQDEDVGVLVHALHAQVRLALPHALALFHVLFRDAHRPARRRRRAGLSRAQRLLVGGIVAACGRGQAACGRRRAAGGGRQGQARARQLQLTSEAYKCTGSTGREHREQQNKTSRVRRHGRCPARRRCEI